VSNFEACFLLAGKQAGHDGPSGCGPQALLLAPKVPPRWQQNMNLFLRELLGLVGGQELAYILRVDHHLYHLPGITWRLCAFAIDLEPHSACIP
jgi:hypothetical protein